eukprot:m51a1_g14632 hypothetical protein (215) ;mRNA; f:24353-25213
MKRRTLLRLQVAAVEVALGLFALGCVAAAVITPCQMARNAGLVGVRAAVDPLLHRVVEGARTEVLNFLWAAPVAALEALEATPERNLTKGLRKLRAAGDRASRGAMSLRYTCSVYADGEMACVMFDKGTGAEYYQVVLREGGSLTNQRMWRCDPETKWNASIPDSSFTDLGPYNATWYWPTDPLLPSGKPHWIEGIITEVTGEVLHSGLPVPLG